MLSIDKIHHPYALNNPVTVYDEESLTALELVARLAAKLNETIDGVHTLEEWLNKTVEEIRGQVGDGIAETVREMFAAGEVGITINYNESTEALDILVVA